MSKARYVAGSAFGGPDVLDLTDENLDPPEAGEVTVGHRAIGTNFIDILARRGELGGTPPFRLGLEAAGVVEHVGPEVSHLAPGDRVVYAGGPPGAYATRRNVPAARVVRLPDSVDDETAAAVFFKGLTADYLVNRLRPLAAGDTVLFHAAAGGVGALAVPWLKARGVRVVGCVGSPTKADFAASLGCDRVLVTGRDDIGAEVRAFTDGAGVTVAYDSIGKATFSASLASLARFGLLVSYGWASGEVDPVRLMDLREQGSVFLTRPTVSHYTEARPDLVAGAARVFEALEQGIFTPRIHARFPLEQAGAAHAVLEGRESRGAVVLTA